MLTQLRATSLYPVRRTSTLNVQNMSCGNSSNWNEMPKCGSWRSFTKASGSTGFRGVLIGPDARLVQLALDLRLSVESELTQK